MGAGVSWEDLQKPPKKEKAAPKRMRQVGKRGAEYIAWRDNSAIPYLDKTYGHVCNQCGAGGSLDVAHIKSRGTHPELKTTLDNIMWLCRYCHMQQDSGFKYK